MTLTPLTESTIHLVADWLADPVNSQWLDFGGGLQSLSPAHLRIMMHRDLHLLMTFAPDAGPKPIGVVALSNISRTFRTALVWYVLGDKHFTGQGHTSRAVSLLLGHAFANLKLHAVTAWAVAANIPSIRVLARNGFRLIGRQRQCHVVQGRATDRLLFDLLASEYRPL